MLEYSDYMCRELCGSKASRIPSPIRLMLRMVKMMNRLGKTHIHQAPLWMNDWALVSMLPHEAVGGWTPRPRKDT